ncbi:MAG: hypothetical protein ISQ21_08000 [Alphaproteobacteria bacterium]|nr:hypothetical protein [Alphaproteobacteria bacterium]
MTSLHAIENQMARSHQQMRKPSRKTDDRFGIERRLGFLYLVEKDDFVAPHMATSYTTLEWLSGQQRL